MAAANDCWAWQPAQPSRSEQAATLLRLQGPDALRVLHGQSSQAIEGAAPGTVLATCLISPTARMRALARVLVETDGAWLLIEAGDAEAARTSLDRVLFPADRVELAPLQAALLITPVPGPHPAPSGHTEAERWQRLDDSGAIWRLGEQVLLVDPRDAAAAHPLSQRPLLSAAEQERWRIRQGWPSAPAELNDDTNPFELGLADRVSLSKGCYVGQETLAKLATYDGVKQQLRRWCWRRGVDAGPAPAGAELLQGPSGERAGVITSALELEQGALWIGLALVRRSALELQQLQTAGDSRIALSRPDAFVAPPAAAAQRSA